MTRVSPLSIVHCENSCRLNVTSPSPMFNKSYLYINFNTLFKTSFLYVPKLLHIALELDQPPKDTFTSKRLQFPSHPQVVQSPRPDPPTPAS